MDTTWEVVFMLVVLKIPMVYLGVVLWYALKAEPVSEGGDEAGVLALTPPCDWGEWRNRRLAGARGRRPLRPSGRPVARRAPRPSSAVAA